MKHPQSVKGFTLVEILIVVAITSIIAIIAIPQYLGYQERTRLSEAHSELVAINNKIKIKMLANINDSTITTIQNGINVSRGDRITAFIQTELNQKIKEYYDVSAKRDPSTSNVDEYEIHITPKNNNNYRLAIWMNEAGDAYRCTLDRSPSGVDSTLLGRLKTAISNPSLTPNECEKLG